MKKVVTGMAHITCGGLADNMRRTIGDDVDVSISLKDVEVPAIFDFIQSRGNIAQEEMYKVFNMGIGYTLIVRPAFAESICAHLQDSGESPVVLGTVSEGSGKIHLSDLHG